MGKVTMRRTRARFAAFVVALTAASGLLAAPSLAQSPPPEPVGVEIQPAKLERDLGGRSVSAKLLIVNHEPTSRHVMMSVAGLGHDLDGTPQFLERSAARDALRVSATDFVLETGERRELVVDGAIPADERSLYAGIIAEFEPLNRPAGQVEVRSRVASLFLLRGPKPWDEKVSVVDVGVIAHEGQKRVTVYAAAKNTGDVHVKPTGRVRILKDGVLLDTVELTPEIIIPEFARRLRGSWIPPEGLTGTVTLEAELDNPSARGTGTVDFTKGAAARPLAEIVNLRSTDEGGPLVTFELRNIGTVPLSPVVTMVASQDKIERAREDLVRETVAPGRSVGVEWRPQLREGVYLITAQVKQGGVLLDQDVTDLRVGTTGTTGNAAAKLLSVLALVILLLVSGAMWLFLWTRRRDERRRDADVLPIPASATSRATPASKSASKRS